MASIIYVGGAKSDNMIEDLSSNCFEEAVKITKEQYASVVEKIDGKSVINCWGHSNNEWGLPQALDNDGNRLSVKMEKGNILLYAQHIGQRRNENGEIVGEATTAYYVTKVIKRTSTKKFEDFIQTTYKHHYGDGSCYYNGYYPCSRCGECND